MAKFVRDVMTKRLATVNAHAVVVDAAGLMLEQDIGAVIVTDDDDLLCGILTDRDIVVRCIAQGKDPCTTTVSEVCSSRVNTLSADEEIDDAVRLMRETGVRRLPVEDDGEPIGIVSLGDLAQERDRNSVLGTVSARSPNR